MKVGNVIEVNNVYKKFKSYFDKSYTLTEKVLHRNRDKYSENWILNGISFEVKKGEAVGLVGKNGCGKSTTLKLLTKIIYPDKGNIEIQGRVSSLLELGAGFHPDLSGYENIYLNASVFGLSKKEIDNRIDEIIRFSELEEYINNPIRTYSSGMYMKLAFSVAINVDADILLIDEILGVGDVSFQKKCFEKLMEIKAKGTTIVIVSHSTGQIEQICDRSIWLEQGKIKQVGTPKEVHENYLDIMENRRLQQKKKEEEERKREQKKREEEENKRKKLAKKNIEKSKKEIEKNRKAREEERLAIQQRKEYRRSVEEDINIEVLNKEEVEKQKKFLDEAELRRQKQKEIQKGFKLDEIPENEMWVEYHKKEANRLEMVVEEKNIELERLDSVIRQKELEIKRLERTIVEHEMEMDRLNEVILDKDEKIDELTHIIIEHANQVNN